MMTFMEVKVTKRITTPSHDSLSTFVGQSDDIHGDATHQTYHQAQLQLTIHVCRTE